MNEENNIENELNELPGYIQSIINDCYTFDKKDCSNQIEDNNNFGSNIENINFNFTYSDKNQNSNFENNYDLNNENDKDIIDDIYNDKENDINIENIFNTKNDFFNPKKTDKNDIDNSLINNKNNNSTNIIKTNSNDISNESKENINTNNLENTTNTNINCNSNNISNNGIKLYCIQENNLLNIKRSFRLQNILQNNFLGYQNNTFECSICFRRIQNYGLLSNCDDVFCYDCIKQWRTEAISKNKREMFRRCPICNCESPMLIKSKTYVSGEEKRKKFYELKQEKKISQVNQ